MSDVLAAIAAQGLLGATVEAPATPFDDAAFDTMLGEAVAHRLTGYLLWSANDGRLRLTDDQLQHAADVHDGALAVCLRLERLLLDVHGLFAAAGIEIRVLKGPAIAHLDHLDPAVRTFGDIDVLVRSEDWERACATLTDAGHRRRYHEPRPGFDRRFGKGVCFVTPDGYEIDLHRTFTSGPFALRIELDDLWADGQTFELGSTKVTALSREHRLLHACYHAALGSWPPQLSPLRDVALLALDHRTDHQRVIDAAVRWGGGAVVARAVQGAWSRFEIGDVVGISAFADRYRYSDDDERDLAASGGAERSYPAQAAASIRAIDDPRDKVAYARAMLFPERSYIESRDRGYLRRLVRAVRLVTRRGQR